MPRNGLVDLRISAVHSATHYYARILRHKGNDGITDMTANHLIVEERMKEYFIDGAESVAEGSVQVGNLYATLSLSGQYERVRVERVSDVDYEVTELHLTKGILSGILQYYNHDRTDMSCWF